MSASNAIMPTGSARGYPVLRGRLRDSRNFFSLNARRLLLPLLFEPTLVKMTGQRMTLHGYQIHTWQGEAVHYAQVWLLKPDQIK